MSKESVKKFSEDIKADKELRSKVSAIVKGINKDLSDEFVKAVGELGYDFTLEEYNAVSFSDEEIGKEELENVAGGRWWTGSTNRYAIKT